MRLVPPRFKGLAFIPYPRQEWELWTYAIIKGVCSFMGTGSGMITRPTLSELSAGLTSKVHSQWVVFLVLGLLPLLHSGLLSPSLCPKLHPIPYILHHFWPGAIGLYIGNRVPYGMQPYTVHIPLVQTMKAPAAPCFIQICNLIKKIWPIAMKCVLVCVHLCKTKV